MDSYKKANIDKYRNSEERRKFREHPTKIVKVEAFRRICYELVGQDEKILDIGGGAGVWTDIIREAGITDKIYAVDISEDILKERNPKDICQVGDMENLPYPDNTFDRALFFSALHHVKNTDRALNEAKRVVRPGGHIVLYEPISLRLLLSGKGIEPTSDGVEFSFSISYLLGSIKRSGLTIQNIRYEGFKKRFIIFTNSISLLRLADWAEAIINKIPIVKDIVGIFGNSVIIINIK